MRGRNQTDCVCDVGEFLGMIFLCLCDALFILGGDSQVVVTLGAEQPCVEVPLVQLIDHVVAVDNGPLVVVQTARVGDYNSIRRCVRFNMQIYNVSGAERRRFNVKTIRAEELPDVAKGAAVVQNGQVLGDFDGNIVQVERLVVFLLQESVVGYLSHIHNELVVVAQICVERVPADDVQSDVVVMVVVR